MSAITHGRRAMAGRDPDEPHRVATSLELIYDLVFVVAFGVSGANFAHSVAAGHVWSGLAAFVFCAFGVILAWVSFTWFASAYDTDDWLYRVLAMVQMMGVALLALGIPDIFRSLEEGGVFHNEILVAGYVVMRVALILQFVRALVRDPSRRPVLLTYVVGWSVAQVGWVALIVLEMRLPWVFLWMLPLYVIELGVPWLAERKGGMPWHPHHVAERYSLLAIIALGEVVVGTIAALGTLVSDRGWTLPTVLLLVAGMGVTLQLWWVYFMMPMGQALHARRGLGVLFNYLHYPLYMAIAAVGAGLHVMAYHLDPEHAGFDVEIGAVGALLAIAVPVGIFVLLVTVLYAVLFRSSRRHDGFHLMLLALTALVLTAGVGVVAAGAPVMAGVILVALAPVVTIVGYEARGYRHLSEELATLPD